MDKRIVVRPDNQIKDGLVISAVVVTGSASSVARHLHGGRWPLNTSRELNAMICACKISSTLRESRYSV